MSNFPAVAERTLADVNEFENTLLSQEVPLAQGLIGDWGVSIRDLLVSEGGYTNHPADPGGPTNWGITIHDVRRFMKADATADDVKALTKVQAIAVYKRKYWDLVQGDRLPAGVDYCVFDYAVNSGPSRAVKVLQRIVGVEADGLMGERTLAATLAKDPVMVINAIMDERLMFLRHLKTWSVFGVGWGRRVVAVRRDSLAMAKGAPPAPRPEPKPGPAPKPWWQALIELILGLFGRK